MESNPIWAKLESYNFNPTYAYIDDDRIWFRRTSEFDKSIAQLLLEQKFEYWPRILTTPTHTNTAIQSWRERCCQNSLQLVLHNNDWIEADIDSWNPNFGAFPALVHIIQVGISSIGKLFRRKKKT